MTVPAESARSLGLSKASCERHTVASVLITFEIVFSSFSLLRCEIQIVPGSFKNLYQDNGNL